MNSVQNELSDTLERMAILSQLWRSRHVENGRAEINGGTIDELRARTTAAVTELRKLAQSLEQALA